MSFGTLDTVSHVLATLFLVYRIADTPFEPFVKTAVEALAAEHKLRVCGSVAAAQANLRDTLQVASESEKVCFERGYQATQERFEHWRASGDLPGEEECIIVRPLNKHRVEIFRAEPYRLDGVDDPKRRVNWSYRISLVQQEI